MTNKDLQKIITAAGARSSGPLRASVLPALEDVPQELERAIADAVAHGQPIAVVSAAADLAPLAVLDALEAVATHDPHTFHPSGNKNGAAILGESDARR
ncbi:hypothetical protein [Arthrobacter sp. Br18]|uniref:hypothetical protein n=1 Tax=Arthrobacter sp. Br18 TaxID=1312954 RepID=UPI00047BB869|nr:hypothetical protein [Arthrobacter sp. Br18]